MSAEVKRLLAMEKAAGPLATIGLAAFVGANPRWRGAKFADVLGELYDGDAYCGAVEDFFDEPDRPSADTTLVALAVITLTLAGVEVTTKAVYDLVAAASQEIP